MTMSALPSVDPFVNGNHAFGEYSGTLDERATSAADVRMLRLSKLVQEQLQALNRDAVGIDVLPRQELSYGRACFLRVKRDIATFLDTPLLRTLSAQIEACLPKNDPIYQAIVGAAETIRVYLDPLIEYSCVTIFDAFHDAVYGAPDDTRKHLHVLLDEFTYRHLLSPSRQLEMEALFCAGRTGELTTAILSLAGRCQVSCEEHAHILRLLGKNQPHQALAYLQTGVLLSELGDEEMKKKEWLRAHIQGSMGSMGIDELHALVARFTARKQIMRWIQDQQIDLPPSVVRPIHAALQNDDPAAFSAAARRFFSAAATDQPPREAHFYNELKAASDRTGAACDSLFVELAHEISRERYIVEWESRMHALTKALEEDPLRGSAIPHIEIVVAHLMRLCGSYECLLKSLSSDQILTPTPFAAHSGYVAETCRRIDRYCRSLVRPTPVYVKGASTQESALKAMSAPNSLPHKEEKTLLFLYASYGSGHRSAMEAIGSYVQQETPENAYRYTLRRLNIPLDVILPLDTIHNTLGQIYDYMNEEWMFNTLLQKDQGYLLETLKQLASSTPTPEFKNKIKELLRQAILKEKPDMLVVTYTAHNAYLIEVADELGLPLLHVTTDLDCSTPLNAPPTHPEFKMAISFDHPKIRRTVGNSAHPDQVVVTGPAIRLPFERAPSAEEIQAAKAALGIQAHEKIVLFSSGGVGVPSSLPELLAKSWDDPNTPLRIIVVTGKNREYAESLRTQLVPQLANIPHVKLNVCGEVNGEEMARLMYMADLFNGKPGGLTVFEAMHTGIPFLGDQLSHRISWERFNNDMLIELGQGDKITDARELVGKVKSMLRKGHHPRTEDAPSPSRTYAQLISDMIAHAEANETFMRRRDFWQPAALTK